MRPCLLLALCLLSGCDGLDELISGAKEAVKRQLRDPESAQFRDVKRCTGDRNVVTGEVNSRNGFGGYAGFEPFFYADYRVAMAGSTDGHFTELMNRCYSNLSQGNQSTDNGLDAPIGNGM